MEEYFAGRPSNSNYRLNDPPYIFDITKSAFKGAIIVQNSYFTEKTIEHQRKFEWKTLNQKVLSFYKGMAFEKHHHLFPSFNNKIVQLTNGGLIDHWFKRYTKHRYLTEKPQAKTPVVLTMNHLSVGFRIWAFLLAVSCVAFICENLFYWGIRITKMLFFEQILDCYYEILKYSH